RSRPGPRSPAAARARAGRPRTAATRTPARPPGAGRARAPPGGRGASPAPPRRPSLWGAGPPARDPCASPRGRARATPRRRPAARVPRPPPGAGWPPPAPRRPSAAPSLPAGSSPGGRQRLGLLARHQGVHYRVEVAVEDPIELVQGQVHPVIGHPALREVVGPDLLRAIARADHRSPVGSDLGLLLLLRPLEEAGTQDLE